MSGPTSFTRGAQRWLALGLCLLPGWLAGASSVDAAHADRATVILVMGAPGEEEFGEAFARWAARWETACQQGGGRLVSIGRQTHETGADRDLLQKALAEEAKEGPNELWLVLIGHGTYDGKEAKFNLRGPDVAASELAEWLKPFRRPLAILDTASASAPFLTKLSAEGRVVVTATRSGFEQNYARFGGYLSDAIANPQADLDKDGQTSLLEAYLTASYRTAEFYKTEGRLATEHPLLDDNGDGLGTPAEWFRGVRAVKRAKDGATLDGLRAHQFHLVRSDAERKLPAPVRARRDELELTIARLRDAKGELAEEEYYRRLETLLLEMARLYEGSGPTPK
jgi:hypothetical protein